MAGEELLGLLGSPDLLRFQQTVEASDPFGLAGRTLISAPLDYSNMNAWESGLSSFGKAFMGGFLQNYARSRAADQMASVVNVLPQLKSDPLSVMTPEGVDSSAFNVLRGSAYLKNLQRDEVAAQEQRKFNSDLLGRLLGKKADIVGEDLGYKALGGGVSENPNSPTYKLQKDTDTLIDSLRKEFQAKPVYGDYKSSLIGFKSLVNAAKDPASTSDLELVRGAIQAIEPGMAVREGEAAAVQSSASIPDAWKAALNKALSGESGLPPQVRDGIMRIAARRYEQFAGEYNSEREGYLGLAGTRKLDPAQVVLDPAAPSVLDIYPEYKVPPASAPQQQIPPGMKLQRNPATGATRLVPQ